MTLRRRGPAAEEEAPFGGDAPVKRAVVVVCDGLRFDMVTPELTPNLLRIARHGSLFERYGGVFPSTTRTTSACIATGCLPARNGLEGNAVALDEGQGLVAISVGDHDFRDRLRAATGQTLKVPTLAERMADHGGSVVYSNVSAGAAVFQDPDQFGTLRHRTLSHSPGGGPGETLDVSHDAAGDAAMTSLFLDAVLGETPPPLALMWQCEPDHTQHAVPLGSPAHVDVIRAADAQAGRVFDNLRPEIEAGEMLFLCCSDHGHETVSEIVDLDQLLIDAGFKEGKGSTDVVVAPQGLSATIYLSAAAKPRAGEIAAFLRRDERFGRVAGEEAFAELGLAPGGALSLAVIGRARDNVNEHGVPGSGVAFQGSIKISNNLGCGQHGGLGRFEQNPFLIAVGPGFAEGGRIRAAASAIDLAPTLLAHLGRPADGVDGRALQGAG